MGVYLGAFLLRCCLVASPPNICSARLTACTSVASLRVALARVLFRAFFLAAERVGATLLTMAAEGALFGPAGRRADGVLPIDRGCVGAAPSGFTVTEAASRLTRRI